jgi:hypothetical protein
VGWIFVFAFETLFNFEHLGIQLSYMILDAGGIVEDEQAGAGEIVQDSGAVMEIGEIERDIIERAAVFEFFKIVLPAIFSISMQERAIEQGELASGFRAANRESFASGPNDTERDSIERALGFLIEGTQGFDLIAEELDANRANEGRWKKIDDAAAMAKLA